MEGGVITWKHRKVEPEEPETPKFAPENIEDAQPEGDEKPETDLLEMMQKLQAILEDQENWNL